MRQVAIAFKTTGASPKAGHRVSELLAAELSDGNPTGSKLHHIYTGGDQAEGKTFAAQFDELDRFIGDAHVIVHQGNVWRKFMRIELRPIKSKTARRLLRDIVDVSAWAHTRFPKQRKNLASLAKKVGHVQPEGEVGLKLDIQLLVGIACKMNPTPVEPTSTQTQPTAQPATLPMESAPAPGKDEVPAVPKPLGERLRLCWRVLVGQA